MDGGADASIKNMISLLHNREFFKAKFKNNVCMHGATLKQIITPCVVGYMRVHALVNQGYLDVKFSYSPHFSTTLLSQVSVIEATAQPKQYISQDIQLFFDPNEEVLNQDLMSSSVNLDSVDINVGIQTIALVVTLC